MQQETTRRERRMAARRTQILDGAAKAFGEKGFHRATTKDIAEAADIAEGTIYNYFASKDDLLLALMHDLAELESREALYAQSLDEPPAEFFAQHFSQRLREIQPKYATVLAVLPEILASPALRQRYNDEFMQPAIAMIERHIQARAERGQLAAADYALVSRVVVSIMTGFQMLLLIGDPIIARMWQEPDQIAELLADMLLRGLQPRADEP